MDKQLNGITHQWCRLKWIQTAMASDRMSLAVQMGVGEQRHLTTVLPSPARDTNQQTYAMTSGPDVANPSHFDGWAPPWSTKMWTCFFFTGSLSQPHLWSSQRRRQLSSWDLQTLQMNTVWLYNSTNQLLRILNRSFLITLQSLNTRGLISGTSKSWCERAIKAEARKV